jgi:hypothetical protein
MSTASPITLLARPNGRTAGGEELYYHEGCLFEEAELKEVKKYSIGAVPMALLPRALPREEGASPVKYRSRVYGPHDQTAGAGPDRGRGGPLHTFRYAGHRGQTKLCGIELEALTRATRRHPDLKYVVYAGAAPGTHIPFLAELFPRLEWHLYDPAEFRVRGAGAQRVFAARGLFTDDLARAWRPRAGETFFISDIRSGDHSQDEFEREVWQNMQMQRGWCEIMGPAASLLKFRLPYTDGAVGSVVPYLDGEVLLQPFGPNTSTEGRLFVWAGAGERGYDAIAYEDYYFWLNTVIREWASFDCGFDLSRVDGLCLCFDCSRLIQIFREYARDNPAPSGAFADGDAQAAHLIGRMVEVTGQQLRNMPHGDRPADLLADKRGALAAKHGHAYMRRRAAKIHNHHRQVQHAPPAVQHHTRPPAAAQK